MPEMEKTIQVPVPPDMLAWLTDRAKRGGERSVASVAREAIRASMEINTAETAK